MSEMWGSDMCRDRERGRGEGERRRREEGEGRSSPEENENSTKRWRKKGAQRPPSISSGVLDKMVV